MSERSPRERSGSRSPVRVAGQRARQRAHERVRGPASTADPTIADGEPLPADAEPAADEVADPGLPEGRRVSRRPGRRWAVAVVAALAVLAVVLGAADGLTLYFGRQHSAVHAARGEALAAGKRAAASINSYSYKNFDSDTKAAAKHFTSSFRHNYQQLTTKIRPTVKKYHAVVLATPNGAAAKEVTSDSAVVLVSLNQITTSTKLKNPRLDRYRLRLSMVKRDNHWLVDNEAAL
jgi:Mce-associated membrane protein